MDCTVIRGCRLLCGFFRWVVGMGMNSYHEIPEQDYYEFRLNCCGDTEKLARERTEDFITNRNELLADMAEDKEESK